MKSITTTICLITIMLTITSTHAEDFTLTGTQNLDITTPYFSGYLYDSSSANALTGGEIYYTWLYDQTQLNIAGATIFRIDAYNNSTTSISSGTIGAKDIFLHNSSTMNISGGNTKSIHASDTSNVDISGGNIELLNAIENSIVTISAGTLQTLAVSNLTLNAPQRITITNGTVHTLDTWINLQNNQTLNYAADFTPADMASYGIHAAPATITSIETSFSIKDTATLSVSGSTIDLITAKGSSTANISNGNINHIYAYENTNINITGANINYLHLNDNCTAIFEGRDFILGNGLSWDTDGQTILGTGTLTGTWFDGTNFDITILNHSTNSTTMAIPEPATILILTLGALTLRKKHYQPTSEPRA